MCNDYAREIEAGRVIAAMKEMENVPPFSYAGGRIPNDPASTPHIKIRDRGLIPGLWFEMETVGSASTSCSDRIRASSIAARRMRPRWTTCSSPTTSAAMSPRPM